VRTAQAQHNAPAVFKLNFVALDLHQVWAGRRDGKHDLAANNVLFQFNDLLSTFGLELLPQGEKSIGRQVAGAGTVAGESLSRSAPILWATELRVFVSVYSFLFAPPTLPASVSVGIHLIHHHTGSDRIKRATNSAAVRIWIPSYSPRSSK